MVGTGYEGRITRYNWTGSMRKAFLLSGLFEWKPMTFSASRGDVYLDEQNHTAVCVQNDGAADLLADINCRGYAPLQEGAKVGANDAEAIAERA